MKWFFALLLISSSTFGTTLSIGTWNTQNNPDNVTEDSNFNTVIDLMGRFAVLGLNETDTGSSVRFQGLVNARFGVTSYMLLTSGSIGGDRNGILYDSSQLTLLNSVELVDSDLVRPVLRAKFRPIGSTNADFYFYTTHLRSGSTSSNRADRALEATFIRNNATTLEAGSNVILSGDLNVLRASEVAFTNLTSSGAGQFSDLADAVGEWRDNDAFRMYHSQDPGASMDDRFDFILGSSSIDDNVGFDYMEGSYRTIGNNGTHTLNSSLDTGSGATSAQLQALMDASDHLPVLATFEILPSGPFTQANALLDTDLDGIPFVLEGLFGGDPDQADAITTLTPIEFLSGADILALNPSLSVIGNVDYPTTSFVIATERNGLEAIPQLSEDLSFTDSPAFEAQLVERVDVDANSERFTYVILPVSGSIPPEEIFIRLNVDLSVLPE